MGQVLLAGIVPKLTVPTLFPEEPTGYVELERITESITYIAPASGYYQIDVYGASGNGGNAAAWTYSDYDEDGNGPYTAYCGGAGGGGGGGGYASSIVKLNKDDLVLIVVGAVGEDTTVNINSTVENYDSIAITSGGNGGNAVKKSYYQSTGGAGGAGGVASGGDTNINGNAGTKAVDRNGGAFSKFTVNGGAGGVAVNSEANAGGVGGTYTNNSAKTPGAGSPGFIKIYAGNTN